MSATWGTIIVAPLTSTLAAAAIVEESPSPPRLPSFPSVAEAVGSAAAVAVISARSELSERQLKHTSREHWLPRAVESLRAQGRVGDIVSVRALPTREEREEEEEGGEEASHPSATNATVFERFLIAHRGFGRCCNAWCMPAGTDPRDARHWGISRCGGAAIREAPVLLLARRRGRPGGQRRRQQQQHQRRRQQRSKNEESGKAGGEPADFVVEREYLAGKLFMPHSVTLGPVSVASPSASASASTPGSEPSAEVFYVVDHLLDQVLTVSLATGAEVGPRLGTPWSLAALRRGADLGAFAGAHRAFYPRAAVEEEEERGRLQGGGSVGGGGGGGSVLVEPTAAVGTRDGARVFVGSGYLDARVVAFDPRSGAVVAQVVRGAPMSLAAMAAEVGSGRPGAPVDAHVPFGQVEELLEALRGWRREKEKEKRAAGGAEHGGDGGGGDPDGAVLDALSRAVARGTASSRKKWGRRGGGGSGSGADGPGVPLSAVVAALRKSRSAETRALADDPLARGGLGWTPAAAASVSSASSSASWPWQNPHSLAIDDDRRLLYVANRERASVDALDLESLKLVCTYSLTTLGGGGGGGAGGQNLGSVQAFSVVRSAPSGRLFVHLVSRVPMGSAIVELSAGDCGRVLAAYPTPRGQYPMHDLAVVEDDDGRGGLSFVVATRTPETYYLPPPDRSHFDADCAAASNSTDAGRGESPGSSSSGISGISCGGGEGGRFSNGEQVKLLLALQWGSMLFLALLLPAGWFAARALILVADAAYDRCCAAARRRGKRGGGGWAPGSRGGGGGEDEDRRLLLQHAAAAAPHPSSSSFQARGEVEMPALGGGALGGGSAVGGGQRSSGGGGSRNGGGSGRRVAPSPARSSELPFPPAASVPALRPPPEQLPQHPRAAAALPKSPFDTTEAAAAAAEAAAAAAEAAAAAPRPGQVLFVRHGESTSNERGILAGVIDVGLTRFGRLQAARAGADVARRGVRFDAVVVSNLRRTAYTAKHALAACGQSHLRLRTDARIAERSFGIFAGQSIRLLQMGLGE